MKFVWIIVAVVLIAICAAGGFAFWVKGSLNSPKEHEKSGEYIVIEKGSSPSQIVAKLRSEGIIASTTPLMIYLRTLGDSSKLKAGEYRFPSPISPLEALALLEKGEERTTRLVIPEGFTRFDIAKRIAEFQTKNQAVGSSVARPTEQQILAMMDDTSQIKDIAPQARNLEGYMYPSTYTLSPDATPDEIINMMVGQFRKVWKPDWTEKARALGRTPHEIVTIASLIETETGVPSERPVVASVINNRLAKGIPLGIDQTNVYIAKMLGKWDGTIHKSDLEVDSPYNTRRHAGIPPGPISSVSESSIEAALNPATTDHIFYVRNVQANDGSHWFYSSSAEFERGKAEYQRWLEKERQEKRANTSQ